MCISYLCGSDYDEDGDLQDGNAHYETVSDIVTMIWPNAGDKCECEEYDGNVEAVKAVMRKELQDQRLICLLLLSQSGDLGIGLV